MLRAVLNGEAPAGKPLAERKQAWRRAGWALVFAPPKSISLLEALLPPSEGATLRQAQGEAVGEALEFVERRVCWARRDRTLVAGEGVVAAVWQHTLSAAGDPHLHNHVLLANLVRASDQKWSALDSGSLWLWREAIGAVYDLSLRHHLARLGLEMTVGTSGAVEVANVPLDALRAVSTRRDEVSHAVDNIDRPSAYQPSAYQRRIAKYRTRVPSAARTTASWQERTKAAGFGQTDARAIAARAEARARETRGEGPAERGEGPADRGEGPAQLDRAAEDWLAAHSSTFSAPEAMKALGATCRYGLAAGDAEAWMDRFCARGLEAPRGRWRSESSRRNDERIVATATVARHLGIAREEDLAEALYERSTLDATARQTVRRLALEGRPVEVLSGVGGKSNLLAQAAVLDAARAAWQASGYEVVVFTPSQASAQRWRALSALAASSLDRVNASIAIIDQADRLIPSELADLVTKASREGLKLVLVEGGTLPARRWPLCEGLELLGERIGACPPGDCPAPQPQAPTLENGSVAVLASLPAAVGHLLDRWDQTRRSGEGAPWLVGLGPAEAEALNTWARARLSAEGKLTGAEITVSGRPFRVGERVLSLRRTLAPAGSLGEVVQVDPERGMLHLRWPDRATQTVGPHDAAAIAHGYATTPRMLRLMEGEALLLGHSEALGHQSTRVKQATILAPVTPTPPRSLDRLDQLARSARAEQRLLQEAGRGGPGRGEAGPPALGPPGAARVGAGPPALDPPGAAHDPEHMGSMAGAGGATLEELGREHDALRASLAATLPADPTGDRRRLEEDLAWALGTGTAGALGAGTLDAGLLAAGAWRSSAGADATPDLLVQLAARQRDVLQREALLHGWVRDHAEDLARLWDLSRRIEARRDALGLALECDSEALGRHGLGPPPDAPKALAAWKRALREIASYSECPPSYHSADMNDPSPSLETLERLRRKAVMQRLAEEMGMEREHSAGIFLS